MEVYPLVMSSYSYWSHGHRNSELSHEKWWLSIVFGMFTRGEEKITITAFPRKKTHEPNWSAVCRWILPTSFWSCRVCFKRAKSVRMSENRFSTSSRDKIPPRTKPVWCFPSISTLSWVCTAFPRHQWGAQTTESTPPRWELQPSHFCSRMLKTSTAILS